ncbi:MAG: ECF family RNA polymerase sigma factor SbrI [Anaerolineales bacterium]
MTFALLWGKSKIANLPVDFSTLLDADLLKYIGNGDEQAFEVLYRRHSEALYNYLLRLVHESPVAEDLLQETFLAVWRNAQQFRGGAQVRTWLFQIAHHRAVSWLRKQRQQVDWDTLEPTLADPQTRPEPLLLQNLDVARVQRALAQLSARHRSVVELAFVQEFSYREIAEILQIPEGTVKSRMSTALKLLAHYLEHEV